MTPNKRITMIQQFEDLSPDDRNILLTAPAIISVLASTTEGHTDQIEKADAIRLAHLKTFSANPALIPYYKEVEKSFKANFEETAKMYYPFDENNRNLMQEKIRHINHVIGKLDHEYASDLHESLQGYSEHVKKAYKGLVFNFLFPFSIAAETD